MEGRFVRAVNSTEWHRKSLISLVCLMEFANNNKHQMRYLFPRQTNAPSSTSVKAFPSVDLTNLTDSICIDLFSQMALDTPETSTVATIGSAADETYE